MGARADYLGRGLEARLAASRARWRRFIANGIANQPSATELGSEFRDETESELELKELMAQRDKLDADLAAVRAEPDNTAAADLLRREIEQIEGAIARERQTKKD